MTNKKITACEAADLIGVTPATLANWRSYGYGPEYKKEGHRVVYSKAAIEAWKKEVNCKECGQRIPHRSR